MEKLFAGIGILSQPGHHASRYQAAQCYDRPWSSEGSCLKLIFYVCVNPYPGKWGVKGLPRPLLPLYLRNCKIHGHALLGHCPGPEGYLSPYKVLSHLYRKCGQHGVKPEVHFRKSAKSRMPDCKSHDYKQQTLSSTTVIFHGHLAWIWFIDVNIHCYLRPKKTCLVFGNLQVYLVPAWNYNYFRFRAWPWCYLSYLTSTCSTWCCFSFYWVHGHLKSLTGYWGRVLEIDLQSVIQP